VNWQAKLRDPKTLRLVFGVKFVIILGAWIAIQGGFTIGDKPATASEKTPAEQVKEDKPAGEKSAKAEKTKEVEATKEPDAGGKTRKSFLSNLLELPDLDPGAIQKEELGKYLEIAERKKRQVEERLEILKKREDQLKGLEASIDDKLKRLDEERRFFSQTIQQEKNLKGERLDKLVATYTKMEPKKAAPVLEKLDKDLVVELFKAMPQKQITAILEAMSPDKSVMISEYYGRVRSTREYDVLKEMNQSLRKEFDDCKGMPAPKE
jgi:flagellar motility protein MotE (MotC chaperone)